MTRALRVRMLLAVAALAVAVACVIQATSVLDRRAPSCRADRIDQPPRASLHSPA